MADQSRSREGHSGTTRSGTGITSSHTSTGTQTAQTATGASSGASYGGATTGLSDANEPGVSGKGSDAPHGPGRRCEFPGPSTSDALRSRKE